VKSGVVAEPTLVLRSPPAWDRLSRATFRVRQEYHYAYAAPIHDLRQRLLMLPPEEHGGQRLLERELRVNGAEDVRMLSQRDRFGNVGLEGGPMLFNFYAMAQQAGGSGGSIYKPGSRPGESTTVGRQSRVCSASARPSASACCGCCNTSAHCR